MKRSYNRKCSQILTKKFLIKEYIKNKKSSIKLAKKKNSCPQTILNYLKKYNIPIRSIREARKYQIITKVHKQATSKTMKGKRVKGRKKDKDGYISIYSPNHPLVKNDGYVLEHRLVMEKHIGRYLTKKEVVHHINSNPSDNSLKNLMLFKNHSKHLKYERKQYKGKLVIYSY